MANTQTQTEYDRNIRTAYVAMDALQTLSDRDAANYSVARAMGAVRSVINEIEGKPIRTRGRKSE